MTSSGDDKNTGGIHVSNEPQESPPAELRNQGVIVVKDEVQLSNDDVDGVSNDGESSVNRDDQEDRHNVG